MRTSKVSRCSSVEIASVFASSSSSSCRFLLPGLFEPLHQMRLLERACGVAIDRLEKGRIDLREGP
jgi:hypothetical protein